MQSQQKIRCGGCKQLLIQSQFKSHIKSCNKYQGILTKAINNIPNNTQTILLKFYSAQLQLAQQILKQRIKKSEIQKLQKYRKNIEQQMKQMQQMKGKLSEVIALKKLDKKQQPKSNSLFSPHSFSNSSTTTLNTNASINIQNRKGYNIGQQINYPTLNIKLQQLSCNKCGKKIDQLANSSILFRSSQCWHQFCTKCILQYILQKYAKCYGCLPCPTKNCKKYIPQKQIKQLIGQKLYKQFEQAHQQQLRKMMNLVKCCKCSFQFQLQSQSNRFICPNTSCKMQQCKQCKQYPFHNGKSCKQNQYSRDKFIKILDKYKNCRFCSTALTKTNINNSPYQSLMSSCNSQACTYLANQSCIKMLNCGHPCHGLKGQQQCLPCLDKSCCKDMVQLCKICKVKPLQKLPCVRINCGHMFHQKCLSQKLIGRWKTPRITFEYCSCPICKKFISAKIPNQHQLSKLIKNNLQFFNKIQRMAVQRLNQQKRKSDIKLMDPKSKFYQKQFQYSMALYSYYQCFKCKKPYYGGKRDCMLPNQQPQLFSNIKNQQLICPNCCNNSIPSCQIHSQKYTEFKCKFCCNTAVWYSQGNHFCDVCYRIKPHVLVLMKSSLPKCQGIGKCPIGGGHNDNGEQKVFGCTICKNKLITNVTNVQPKKFWFL